MIRTSLERLASGARNVQTVTTFLLAVALAGVGAVGGQLSVLILSGCIAGLAIGNAWRRGAGGIQ